MIKLECYFDVSASGILIANRHLPASEVGSHGEPLTIESNIKLWKHRYAQAISPSTPFVEKKSGMLTKLIALLQSFDENAKDDVYLRALQVAAREMGAEIKTLFETIEFLEDYNKDYRDPAYLEAISTAGRAASKFNALFPLEKLLDDFEKNCKNAGFIKMLLSACTQAQMKKQINQKCFVQPEKLPTRKTTSRYTMDDILKWQGGVVPSVQADVLQVALSEIKQDNDSVASSLIKEDYSSSLLPVIALTSPHEPLRKADIGIGRAMTAADVGKYMVRCAPLGRDWSYCMGSTLEFTKLFAMKLEAVQEGAFVLSNRLASFELQKQKWDDHNWMSLEEYEKFLTAQKKSP